MTDTAIRIVETRHEAWGLANPFIISRGSKTKADVVVVEVSDDQHVGRGEAVPYARYGETIDDTLATLRAITGPVEREAVQGLLPAGAARNALDCALWDLEAKRAGKRAWELAGLSAPQPVMTAYTLSVGPPSAMAEAAKAVPHLKLLKLKLT